MSHAHFDTLKGCLDSNTGCDGINSTEHEHVVAWHNFTTSLAARQQVPASALLVALHNLVTEHVPLEYVPNQSRQYHCPEQVVLELKNGLYAGDEAVQNFELASFPPVTGVPGLAPQDDLVGCCCQYN